MFWVKNWHAGLKIHISVSAQAIQCNQDMKICWRSFD